MKHLFGEWGLWEESDKPMWQMKNTEAEGRTEGKKEVKTRDQSGKSERERDNKSVGLQMKLDWQVKSTMGL